MEEKPNNIVSKPIIDYFKFDCAIVRHSERVGLSFIYRSLDRLGSMAWDSVGKKKTN